MIALSGMLRCFYRVPDNPRIQSDLSLVKRKEVCPIEKGVKGNSMLKRSTREKLWRKMSYLFVLNHSTRNIASYQRMISGVILLNEYCLVNGSVDYPIVTVLRPLVM
jgi:hypothetical protein